MTSVLDSTALVLSETLRLPELSRTGPLPSYVTPTRYLLQIHRRTHGCRPEDPRPLLPEVVARHQKGWSLRRVAERLSEEKQLKTSRTAVSSALVRAGVSEPEALADVRAELIEEAPENLEKLNKLQTEREDALIIMKLIAQQERILQWKLRTPSRPRPTSRPTLRSYRRRGVTAPVMDSSTQRQRFGHD